MKVLVTGGAGFIAFHETSINQLFNCLKDIINPSIKEKHVAAKQGEQHRSVIDYTKAKNILHWQPESTIIDRLKKNCEFFSKNTN